MKFKIKTISLILILSLSLCGCAADTSYGAARYIDPYLYGGGDVVPAEAPSVALGKKQAAATAVDETAFTENAAWEIRDGRFVHAEFRFDIPARWREHFAFETVTKDVSGYSVRLFGFSYTAASGDVKLMSIECAPAALLGEIGLYKTRERLGESSDGQYVYFISLYDSMVPRDDDCTADCTAILSDLMSGAVKITITV